MSGDERADRNGKGEGFECEKGFTMREKKGKKIRTQCSGATDDEKIEMEWTNI
jgi:hypothetical protein